MTEKQFSMFESGDDLPLFSGTVQKTNEPQFQSKPEPQQGKLYSCPNCRDTGYTEWEIQIGSLPYDRKKIACSFCEAGKKYREETKS